LAVALSVFVNLSVGEALAQASPPLPHAFANLYATPPCAQAVAAHADDRDVFVLQVSGAKAWRVYGAPPVPLPYPNEQVGEGIGCVLAWCAVSLARARGRRARQRGVGRMARCPPLRVSAVS
jgi:hypothetical protein